MTVDRPGWMLALVEPTEEMLANTVDDRGRPRILDFTTPEERGEAFIMPRYIYRAMIAASPPPGEDEVERLAEALHTHDHRLAVRGAAAPWSEQPASIHRVYRCRIRAILAEPGRKP